MATNTDCLSTKVRNVSGGTMMFSFLPPHGKTLRDGEETLIPGDLNAYLSAPRMKRKRDGFHRALLAGLIQLESSPAVQLYDPTLAETKVLHTDNGVLTVVDPCWGTASSSMTGAHHLP